VNRTTCSVSGKSRFTESKSAVSNVSVLLNPSRRAAAAVAELGTMQHSRHVRQHMTSAQRQSILADYRQGQRTQKECAAQAGISVSTLQAWLRKRPARPVSAGPAFVAVPNLLSASPSASAYAYRLQWPGGLSLEVRSGFSAQELAALLELLPKP
jgi:DNA-binding CsgD family transcriptional regulator